jgi:hypothetical protein
VHVDQHMKVNMLESFYDMIRESRFLYGVEIWREVGDGKFGTGTGEILQGSVKTS